MRPSASALPNTAALTTLRRTFQLFALAVRATCSSDEAEDEEGREESIRPAIRQQTEEGREESIILDAELRRWRSGVLAGQNAANRDVEAAERTF